MCKAQFGLVAFSGDLKDDVGRKLKIVEGRAHPLIGFAPTATAAEFTVAKVGCLIELSEFWRLAMRADHSEGSALQGSERAPRLDLSPDNFRGERSRNTE